MSNTVTLIRDVAIIVLAVQSIVVGVLLIILLLQIKSLTELLQREIRPILTSVQDTAGTVRGTASVVSDYVVTPVARVASVVAGVREAVATLWGRPSRGTEF